MTYEELARAIAEREHGARALERADLAGGSRAFTRAYNGLGAAGVAHELSQARAHIERAARLAGVDTGAFPRVAHGGTDLREPQETAQQARERLQDRREQCPVCGQREACRDNPRCYYPHAAR